MLLLSVVYYDQLVGACHVVYYDQVVNARYTLNILSRYGETFYLL